MSRTTLRNVAIHLLVLVVSGLVFLIWTNQTRPALTGDEPCYLLQAKSLVDDQDLNLGPDVARDSGVAQFSPDVRNNPGACSFDYNGDDNFRGWFNVGLPLLLVPVAALSWNIDVIRFALVGLSTLFAWQLFGLLHDVAGNRGRSGTAVTVGVWVATVFLMPVVAFSNQIYPEIPAALLCTLAARCMWIMRDANASTLKPAVAASVSLGLLPLLHFRYLLLAAGLLGLVIALYLRSQNSQPLKTKVRLAVLGAPLIAPLALCLAALLGLSWYLYGSPSPAAAYDNSTAVELVPTTADTIYRFSVGSLLGGTQGLIPVNPVFLIALAGLPLLIRRFGWAGAWLCGLFLAQVFAINPLGYFGYTLPGRFLIVLVPLLSLALLLVMLSCTERRSRMDWGLAVPIAAVGLVAASLVPLTQAYNNYGSILDIGRPQAEYQRDLEDVWPSFSETPGVTSFQLSTDQLTQDKPSELELREGSWSIDIPTEPDAKELSATVVKVKDRFLDATSEVITTSSVTTSTNSLELDFDVTEVATYSIQVSNPAALRANSLITGSVAGAPQGRYAEMRDDVPLAMVWLAGVALLAVALWRRESKLKRAGVHY